MKKHLAWGHNTLTKHSEVCASRPRANYFPVPPDPTQSISILSYDHWVLKISKILFQFN